MSNTIMLDSDFKVEKIVMSSFDFGRLIPLTFDAKIKELGEDSGMAKRYRKQCETENINVADKNMDLYVIVGLNNGNRAGLHYHIKRGWVTDFASVPKLLRSFVDDNDPKITIPAIAHDIAYAIHGFPFIDANKLFKEMIDFNGASEFTEWASYLAVSTPEGRKRYYETDDLLLQEQYVSMEIVAPQDVPQ